jgi:hypothetical protein
MKNLKIILFAFLSLSLITGCDKDFEEINTDPNSSVELPAHLLLGYSQRFYTNTMHSVLGGAGGDMGAIWAQMWTKVQYNGEFFTALTDHVASLGVNDPNTTRDVDWEIIDNVTTYRNGIYYIGVDSTGVYVRNSDMKLFWRIKTSDADFILRALALEVFPRRTR